MDDIAWENPVFWWLIPELGRWWSISHLRKKWRMRISISTTRKQNRSSVDKRKTTTELRCWRESCFSWVIPLPERCDSAPCVPSLRLSPIPRELNLETCFKNEMRSRTAASIYCIPSLAHSRRRDERGDVNLSSFPGLHLYAAHRFILAQPNVTSTLKKVKCVTCSSWVGNVIFS